MRISVIQTGEVQIKSRHQHARFRSRPARAADVLFDPSWSPRLPIQCWTVEHEEGLIVVDTGESARANDPGYQPRWHPFMRLCERRWVAADEEVGPQLKALGHDPSTVRWVVMSHMHGDHAGGLGHFPQSEIVMSGTEARAALALTGPLTGYLNRHYPSWLRPRTVEFEDGPWESFDRSTALTRDGRVRLLPTPGHTKGHLSVAVERSDHVVLIGGDAAYDETALLAGTVDGVAFSHARHQDTTRRLRELCRRRRTVVQFAHDPSAVARLEAVRATQAPAEAERAV